MCIVFSRSESFRFQDAHQSMGDSTVVTSCFIYGILIPHLLERVLYCLGAQIKGVLPNIIKYADGFTATHKQEDLE